MVSFLRLQRADAQPGPGSIYKRIYVVCLIIAFVSLLPTGMMQNTKAGSVMPMPVPMPGKAPSNRKLQPSRTAATAQQGQGAAVVPAAAPAAPAVKPAPQASAMVAPTAAEPAAAEGDDDDDDEPLQPDEEVTVEPEELEVFEKVAAMEREQQLKQQQRNSQEVSTGWDLICQSKPPHSWLATNPLLAGT